MGKGFINILEIFLVAVILIIAFAHFFPQYKVTTDWDDKLMELQLEDTLTTIENLGKVYNFSTGAEDFDLFMENIFIEGGEGGVYVWWNRTEGLPNGHTEPTPFYTWGTEKTVIDVINYTVDKPEGEMVNYTFTIGLGNPY
ncbi:hypothetical protein A3K63_02935 [Candidatus Micrarchaeota archaeon RBG_16_49_10]|nr:MAG: hypothetical protein A3K63_02935 [Candidatus Micrarchaeota archaeon RBG_16_49_10]